MVKIIKRISTVASAAVLGLSSLLTLGLTGVASAASGSDTCTWTGTTDSKFSTATNWSNCSGAAPVNGDNLVFDISTITSANIGTDYFWALNNDISGLQIGSLTFTGTSAGGYYYKISGDDLTVGSSIVNNTSGYQGIDLNLVLSGDVTVTSGTSNGGLNIGVDGGSNTIDTAGHSLTVTGAPTCGMSISSSLKGSGALTSNISSAGLRLSSAADSYTGAVIVANGLLALTDPGALGQTSGVTVSDGGSLGVSLAKDETFAFPLTLNGSGFPNDGYPVPTLQTVEGYGFCAGGSGGSDPYTATFSGPVTLGSDATFGGEFNASITGTYTPNGHKFTVQPGSTGSLTTPQGASTAPVQSNTYSDNQPTQSLSVGNNQTAILDGTRQSVDVTKGGLLKGIGTMEYLTVSDGGIVAPGHSPGKLTVLSTLDLAAGSTYQAELKDTTAGDYDQLVVGKAADTTGNDVMLGDTTGSPTLAVSLYDGYDIKKGDQFTIIDNLSKTDVSGTFQGLAEGATFKSGSVEFSISYKGGDGNDVVLTALNDSVPPKSPDTGFSLAASHPGTTLGIVALITGTILVLAKNSRKLSPAQAKAKRR